MKPLNYRVTCSDIFKILGKKSSEVAIYSQTRRNGHFCIMVTCSQRSLSCSPGAFYYIFWFDIAVICSMRSAVTIYNSNMTSFKRFESIPVVKIILIYDRLNLWRHRQFIAIFYQFLHIRIEIIHGSHMYILFLPRVAFMSAFYHSLTLEVKLCDIKAYVKEQTHPIS
jgi:hypothetical protein